jgi:transposase-like protein
MEEKKIRRRYDREFKEDAVRLVIEGGSPLQGEHPNEATL